MRVTATEDENLFGSPCAQARQAKREKSTRTSRKAFEAEFGAWIAAQNDRFEILGIPGADLRPW